jgi:hypothetical protein
MTTFRSEDVLVGLIGAVLLPLIARRLLRSVREGRVPVYRTYIRREDGLAKFNLVLALHVFSFVFVAGIAADLLFNLGFRNAL